MLEPLPAAQWNETTAAHLLKRAGFGVRPGALAEWTALGLDGAVDRLVEWEKTPDPTPNPDWAKPDPSLIDRRKELRGLPEEERRAKFLEFQREQRQQVRELKLWWLRRLRETPRPLQEKLTLFWHGHFATSVEKVKLAYFMWRQNDLFRRLGQGSLRQLLIEVGRDPAMLVWLDGAQSRKDAPNENYGRELLELFTLGEGHYTEDDIKAAARAFTGWTVNRLRQEAFFVKDNHDGGRKTFLGASGNFGDEAIIDRILAQPQCARWITGKLWTFFAYERPEPALVDALAARFSGAGHEIKPVLHTLFRSREFYSSRALMTQIKSPVQWLIDLQGTLDLQRVPDQGLMQLLVQLGQHLFEPPSVKGWDGGRAWISTNTLLLRQNTAKLLVYGGDPGGIFGREEILGKLKQLQNLRAQANPGEPMDPEMQQRLQRLERAGKRKMDIPPLVDAARLVSAEDRADPARLVKTLTTRLFAAPPPPSALQAFDEYVRQAKYPASSETLQGLVYLMMARPEYQLT